MPNKVFWLCGLFALTGYAHAVQSCWSEPIEGGVIDIDGAGTVQGAWVLSEALLPDRLQKAQGSLNLLVSGYDVLAAQRTCKQLAQLEGKPEVRVVFGGRERFLAQQGVSAWEWLVKPSDALAANLVMGDLSGVFVGEGKAVVGKGLEKSTLTDPAEIAVNLLERFQSHKQPVVLFVGAELQQPFLEFYSANPLPGVFLSFDGAENVRDALNKYANFHADEQAGLLNYYCN